MSSCKEKPIVLVRPLGSYVMENVLFKISYPAEFHAQTAVEAAVHLYPKLIDRWDQIERISITTHESAMRIIDKKGPLQNPADRDHCLQYMVAVALLQGTLKAEHYEDSFASNPLIDVLRAKMHVVEDKRFTEDYIHPDKRSIANTIEIQLQDGTLLHNTTEYPIGHRRRREEAIPLLYDKFRDNAGTRLTTAKVELLVSLFQDLEQLQALSVDQFNDILAVN